MRQEKLSGVMHAALDSTCVGAVQACNTRPGRTLEKQSVVPAEILAGEGDAHARGQDAVLGGPVW
jgi:hypothetical protein